MLPRPPRYTRPHTRVPYTTLFRSDPHVGSQPTDPHHVGDMAMDVEHVGAPRLNQRALARHVQIFARIELGIAERGAQHREAFEIRKQDRVLHPVDRVTRAAQARKSTRLNSRHSSAHSLTASV